ncbi:MAG: sensor histidine kinase [Rhodospirillales bacterium]
MNRNPPPWTPWSYVTRSLIGRLALWAVALTAIGLPIFWGLFQGAVAKVSADVVDTRLLEFSDQVRGYWASSRLGRGSAGPDENLPTSTLGGPDVGWVWQITEDGRVYDQSDLLRLTGEVLKPGLDEAKSAFTLRNAQTPLGPMRLAERIVEEVPPFGEGAKPVRVHYLVGIGRDRYADYVDRHAQRLHPLALLATIPVALVITGMMVVIILALRRELNRFARAMDAYEAGRTRTIVGRFPRELQRLVSRMNGLLDQNAKLIERTRKYVSKIAHDINHPLAVLKNGLAGDIDRAKLKRQVDRMAGLVDRYSSLARAIGPEGAEARRTEVRPALDDVAEGFSIVYRRNPLQITVDCACGLDFVVARHDLEAMVSNLVSNAHKYAETTVEIWAGLEGSTLVVRVDDDGPGIAPEAREAAFNWGKRLDEAPPGTGFGLTIVYDIVALYEGEVRLDTAPLGGLRAEIRLPGPGAV